jgi:hypothetical protein
LEVKGRERLVIVQEVERSYLRKLDVNEVLEISVRRWQRSTNYRLMLWYWLSLGKFPKLPAAKFSVMLAEPLF